MSRRFVGIVLLLTGSLALGILSGQVFFRIYEETVPPALLTRFNVSSAHTYFLWRGAQIGFLYFGWALLAIGVARLFRRRSPTAGTLLDTRGIEP
jgi:hypothetical protein